MEEGREEGMEKGRHEGRKEWRNGGKKGGRTERKKKSKDDKLMDLWQLRSSSTEMYVMSCFLYIWSFFSC